MFDQKIKKYSPARSPILPYLLLCLMLTALSATVFADPPGTLDASFGTAGKALTNVTSSDDEIMAVAIQSDNKIVAVGYSDKPQQFTLARYNNNGTLDTSFGTGGIVKTAFSDRAFAYSVAIQSDGKIVVGGDGGFVFALTRYTAAGALDTTFGTGGKVTTAIGTQSSIQSIAIQSDGKIVAAGYTEAVGDFAVARYTTAGALDTTFGGGDGIAITDFFGDDDRASSMKLQSDGKIVVAGYSYDLDLAVNFALARYTTAGALDTSFDSDGLVTNLHDCSCGFNAMGIQPDGKIVATASGEDIYLARYNTNGSLIGSVGATNVGGTTDTSYALTTDAAGGILIAGSTISSGNGDFFVAKYLSSGTLDPMFDNGDGIIVTNMGSNSDIAHAVAIQPNNGIILGGSQGDFGAKQFAVARYIGQGATAANVNVGGRITKSNGVGISGVTVGLTNILGVTTYALTSSFGYYTFYDIPAGQTYVIAPSSNRYTFTPSVRIITVMDELTDVNFTGS
jgi:uncharacterized delta-60 repeat protein